MQTQYVLSYKIDLYFYNCQLAIEIDKNVLSNRNIDYEIKRQKAIEQELGCKFVRIDQEKEDLDIFRVISQIFGHIKQSTKKTQINKISMRLLGLDFKSDNL